MGSFNSLGTFDPNADVSINTTNDTLTYGSTTLTGVTSGGVSVFTFDSINVATARTITAVGNKPFALLSKSDATIAGTLNIEAASVGQPGPGGGMGGSGGFAYWPGLPNSPGVAGGGPGGGGGGGSVSGSVGGGGGGGFGGNGANGGGFTSVRGAGGQAYGNLLNALQAGSGGGGGGARSVVNSVTALGAPGGSGGGAVEVGAGGMLTFTGSIDAGGSQAGFPSAETSTTAGGGGGGSGGGVLLHAALVSFSGSIQAPGGGGGPGYFGQPGGGGAGGHVAIAPDMLRMTSGSINVEGGINSEAISPAGMPGNVYTTARLLIVPSGQVPHLTGGVLQGGLYGHPYALQGVQLESGATLVADGGYSVNGDLLLDNNSVMVVHGGMTTAHQIEMDGAVVSTLGGFTLNTGGSLSGFGQIAGAVSGASDATIAAVGGNLSLGDMNSELGFAFDGSINIGSVILQIHDRDQASLGALTTLAAGGRLASVNGLLLDVGKNLTAMAGAAIDGPFTNEGAVHAPSDDGQFLTFSDDVNGAGSYSGNILFSDGFDPGNNPAAVSFQNVNFDSSANLQLKIGGLAPGMQHDQLNIAGTAVLGGALDVSLIDGFAPHVGDTFEILTVGTRLGMFDSVLLPALGGGMQFDLIYGPDTVVLAVVGLSGDYNQNGIVDAADYTSWRDYLGQTFALTNENPAAATPGVVDAEDYDFWKLHFGESLGSGFGASSLAAIPEPATLVLLLLLVVVSESVRRQTGFRASRTW